MQIEESIRDEKSHRFGFGLEYAKSSSARRMDVLLAIVAIGFLLVWLAGLAGGNKGLHRKLQANTRERNVLSVPFAGRLIILRNMARLSSEFLRTFTAHLRQMVLTLEGI